MFIVRFEKKVYGGVNDQVCNIIDQKDCKKQRMIQVGCRKLMNVGWKNQQQKKGCPCNQSGNSQQVPFVPDPADEFIEQEQQYHRNYTKLEEKTNLIVGSVETL